MPLNPQIADMLQQINRWDIANGPTQTVDDERHRIDTLRSTIWRPEMLPVGSVEDRRIAGPRGPIGTRIYRPEGIDRAAALPTVIYLHGGGWCVGDLDSHESHARRICHRLDVMVVAVDYRLAPEHKFPAGYDDCVAAYRWVLAHADGIGADVTRIVAAGDSAGGNLAAALAVTARDAGLPLAAQLLIYPATDLSTIYPSMRDLHTGYFLTVDHVDQWLATATTSTMTRPPPILACHRYEQIFPASRRPS